MFDLVTLIFYIRGMARPRSNIERKQTGIRLQPRIYRAIQHYAIDAEQSVSEVMERALEEFLQRQGVEVDPPTPHGDQ